MDWVRQIREYNPCNEQEKRDKEIMLQCIDTFDNILNRENEITHITSSGFVVNKNRDKALMIYHNIYNSWSWTGGHADGEEDLLAVAIKEVKEETGVENVRPIVSGIFSLDILTVMGHIKKGKYIAPHLHLSVAYLLEVDEEESLSIKEDENSDVKWIPLKEINAFSTEAHMIRVYDKIIAKMEAFF